MTREEIYCDEFKVRRHDKTRKWWIHWRPFGLVFGSISGPFETYNSAFEYGVDVVHEDYS